MSELFSDVLKHMRGCAGLSQSRLAERADVDHSYVSRLESGARMPARDAVERLAEALKTSVADRDLLLSTAGFMPTSPSNLISCPILAELDTAHAAANAEDRVWIERMALMTLSRIQAERSAA
jgi:transcriptional regulator with XRE-family HTH domain